MAEPMEHGASGLSGAIGSVWKTEGRVGGIIPLLPVSPRSERALLLQGLGSKQKQAKWASFWGQIKDQWRREGEGIPGYDQHGHSPKLSQVSGLTNPYG